MSRKPLNDDGLLGVLNLVARERAKPNLSEVRINEYDAYVRESIETRHKAESEDYWQHYQGLIKAYRRE